MPISIPETIVYDVETTSIGNPYELELSAIATINTADGIPRVFLQDNIQDGIDILRTAKRLAGFNSIKFDNAVMLKYMPRGEGQRFKNLPHWDPLFEMERQFRGQRAPLLNFGLTTLGPGFRKFELANTSAATLFEADPKLTMQYNKWDTKITYLLLLHAYQYGYIKFKLPIERRLYFPNMNSKLAGKGYVRRDSEF